MFAFTPSTSFSPRSHLASPQRSSASSPSPLGAREKYLAALAQAKAAEQEYLAAVAAEEQQQQARQREEALRRQHEEALRRQREEELLRRQREHALLTSAAPAYARGYYPYYAAYEPTPVVYHNAREIEEQQRLAALRRLREAEEERLAALYRQQEEEELKRVALLRQQQEEAQRRAILQQQQAPSVQAPSNNTVDLQDIFKLLLGAQQPQCSPRTEVEPCRIATPVEPEVVQRPVQQPIDLQQLFGLLTGGVPPQAAQAKPAVSASTQPTPQPKTAATPAPKVETPKAETPKVETPKRESTQHHASQEPQVIDPQQFLQALFGGCRPGTSCASPSKPQPEPVKPASKSAVAPVQIPKREDSPKRTEPTPRAPSPKRAEQTAPQFVSLQDLLEGRMRNEGDADVRNTLNGLLSHMFPAAPAAAAHPQPPRQSQPQSQPQPQRTPLKGAEVKPSDNGKGKARAEPREPSPVRSEKEIADALHTIESIDTAFNSLHSDFTFPAHLDFVPSASPSAPVTDTKLAYTAANAPVRYYEHALSQLLSKLDAVESGGSEDVRARRKEVVARVERALEEVEREVSGRMGAWKARNEVQAEKEAETPVSAEAPTTSDAPAVEVTPAPVASSDETSTQPDTHPSAPTPSASLRPIQVTISGPEPSDESPAEEEEPSNFTTAIATPVDPPAQDVSVPVSVPIAIPDIAAPIEPSTNHAAPSASAEQQDNPADVAVAPEPASIPEQSEQLDTPKPTTPNPTTDGPQLDTFLLPASPVFHSPSGPSPAHSDSDKGDAVVVGEPQDSDWSEVDA